MCGKTIYIRLNILYGMEQIDKDALLTDVKMNPDTVYRLTGRQIYQLIESTVRAFAKSYESKKDAMQDPIQEWIQHELMKDVDAELVAHEKHIRLLSDMLSTVSIRVDRLDRQLHSTADTEPAHEKQENTAIHE